MRRFIFLTCTIILFSNSIFSQTTSSKPDAKNIVEYVAGQIEEFNKREYPPDSVFSETPFGSYTEADLQRRNRFYIDQWDTLQTIDMRSIPMADLINLELLKYLIRDQLNYYEFKEYLNPILSDGGFHTGLPFQASVQYSTARDFRLYIHRLNKFPDYAKQQMDLIRKGIAMGISQPVVALKNYESTYNSHITDTVENSVFFQPFKSKPATLPQQTWDSIQSEARNTIATRVVPAYREIKKFFEEEYYPKARKTLGATELPNGRAYYAALVKHHTTTNLSPNDVYNLGMSEVSRIRKEMEAVIAEVNFKGNFSEFLAFLRTDPRFYVTTPEQLLKEASFIAKKIDGKLPSLFKKLPRQPYGVAPVPDHIAPSYTPGRYSGAPINSRNAGEYWVNTYNLPSRPLYTLEALTLHEAVPGHHLQIALAAELEGMLKFRTSFYVNAFGEGWGLYSEFLGTELGLYKDPYSRFGRLTYEMWRACRLVIDVGIHSKGWTREQAVDFLASNSALSMHEVNTEINRYISWPGQALAYKIGELKILELRRKAEKELGEKFDIRDFHDLVLSQGSVTLDILERMVDDWIAKSKVK